MGDAWPVAAKAVREAIVGARAPAVAAKVARAAIAGARPVMKVARAAVAGARPVTSETCEAMAVCAAAGSDADRELRRAAPAAVAAGLEASAAPRNSTFLCAVMPPASAPPGA